MGRRPKEKPGEPSKCRHCQAWIVWTVTARGKNMPADLEPSEQGRFYLFRRSDRIEAIHKDSRHGSVAKALARGQRVHTSHFDTCPARRRAA